MLLLLLPERKFYYMYLERPQRYSQAGELLLTMRLDRDMTWLADPAT